MRAGWPRSTPSSAPADDPTTSPSAMTRRASIRPLPGRVMHGAEEPIFDRLPDSVRANLLHPTSENALVWNALYPRLWPGRRLGELMQFRPLWGTPEVHFQDEVVRPYFWGYAVDGERLPGLDDSLEAVDGPGPKTEVDLFLLGESQLVLIEAKHTSQFGRCRRFAAGRCPLAQPSPDPAMDACRYWDVAGARFDQDLHILLPQAGEPRPECHRHYQLARTLRVGRQLAGSSGRSLHLWLLAPQTAWPRGLRSDWLDFADKVTDPDLWRRLRVLSWETLIQLPPIGDRSATDD